MENNELESIVPFTDAEASKALKEIALHPYVFLISRMVFPKKGPLYLSNRLKKIETIDQFQEVIMSQVVQWIIDKSMKDFTVGGIEYPQAADGKFLIMSNHRDIIIDPAITNYVLLQNKVPMFEICVGSNLLSGSKVVEALLRSNRMIKVIRGISARELYLSSQMLSKYIRERITTSGSSIWIAQRQGRTKNGVDITEQGLLKMLDMSGGKDFVKNFTELNIIPASMSYEYEPCDIKKARELVLSAQGPYVKKKNEDTHSIITGILQHKGRVHLEFGKPITEAEVTEAADCAKNDRYQKIRHLMDCRIVEGYWLWPNNYIAYDLMTGGNKYVSQYTAQEVEAFKAYVEKRMAKVEKTISRDELRKKMYEIYGNPVLSKEKLDAGEL